jgi:anaerobic ribonucleoside-triphosphate reductase activating protein
MQNDFYARTERLFAHMADERHFRPRHFFFNDHVVLQEVPGEISICFNIAGCPLNCPGCSWKNAGMPPMELTREIYEGILDKNRGLATCVAFMGGEWKRGELIALLAVARAKGFKTCLYSGRNSVDVDVLQLLDFIKLGPWRADMGGLDDPNTNQAFFRIERQNHLFQRSKI